MYKYLIIISLFFVVVSCTKEENEDINQSNNFIGDWTCHDNESENSIYAARNFVIDISKTDSNYVISNYASLGIDVTAYFNTNSNNFTVEEQNVDGFLTHGIGSFSNDNKIASFTYYLDDEKITSSWEKN